MRRTIFVSLAVLASVLVVVPALALDPGGTFKDDDGNIHEPYIEAIAAAGITKGCNPPTNDLYCPDRRVTRQEMASFLVRAFNIPPSNVDGFDDDDGTTHEADINALAAAGVSKGCNPPTNDKFCPTRVVSRGEMASFIKRAGGFPATATDYFGDDNGTTHEGDINAIAEAGIPVPCGPGNYCPRGAMVRDVMATFLARGVGLNPVPVPPGPGTGGEQGPLLVTRLKDLPTTQDYHVLTIGEATRKTGGGEYDYTDGTATVELELKGATTTVPLNTCIAVVGSPEAGGRDLAVRDGYGNPDGHGVLVIGGRCPNGIDSL